MSKIPMKRSLSINPLLPSAPKKILKDSMSSVAASPTVSKRSETENECLTPQRTANSDSFSSVSISAKKDYNVKSLRDKLFMVEKDNLKLSTDYSRLSGEKKILQEKYKQLENGFKFNECALKQKLQKKQDELDKNLKLLEDKERCLELNENQLQQLRISFERDLKEKTRKLDEAQAEIADMKDTLRKSQFQLNQEVSSHQHMKKLHAQLMKMKNEELKKLQDEKSRVTSLLMQEQEVEQMRNELQDAKLKIKEFEASEVINSANKCLEKQVRDLKKELESKGKQLDSLKEHVGNVYLLAEEKSSLEKTIKSLTRRLEELTPMEEKWKESVAELAKWKRLQNFIPQIIAPNDVLSRFQDLNNELTSVKNQLVTLNEEKLKEASAAAADMGPSFLEQSKLVSPPERVEFEKDIFSLKETNHQLETELRSAQKKLLFAERQRDSANSVLSSYEKEFETSEDPSLKIIEHLRQENQNYKEMAEEYDATVKELRAELKNLYSALSEATSLNESLMKGRDCSLSFLNQTTTDPLSKAIPGTPDVKSEPVLNQTLTSLGAPGQQEETSPKRTKVLTLKDDLMLQTKLAFISELNDLKSENTVCKKKIVALEAEKKKLLDESMAALSTTAGGRGFGGGVGEQTMAFCVKSTDEYQRLENEYKRAGAALNGFIKRQTYMKEILFNCFGYEIHFKPKESERVSLFPVFRPPEMAQPSCAGDYQIQLERIENVWNIMDNESVVYNTYSHILQDLTHSAPFFAHVIGDLYDQFDPIELPQVN